MALYVRGETRVLWHNPVLFLFGCPNLIVELDYGECGGAAVECHWA